MLGTEKTKHTGYIAGITAKPYMNSSIIVVVRLRPVYDGSPKATKISSEHVAEIRYALKSHRKLPTHYVEEVEECWSEPGARARTNQPTNKQTEREKRKRSFMRKGVGGDKRRPT